MRLHRIMTLPFAFLADAATLGNIGGDRSFTQQIFDSEQREQDVKAVKEIAETITRMAKEEAAKKTEE